MLPKNELRSECIRLLKSISQEQRYTTSKQLVDNLIASAIWKETVCILAYMALPTEFNTEPILQAAWLANKLVFVPKICNQNLIFRRIYSPDDLSSGKFGIREPESRLPTWNIQSYPCRTLVLVPGLAFDQTGNRLGRGGGFYDRFLRQIRTDFRLAGLPAPVCVGICYREQIMSEIPADPWDEKLDGLLIDVQSFRLTNSLI